MKRFLVLAVLAAPAFSAFAQSTEHDRNLRTCMNGWGLCDHSQLTPAEAQKVAVAEHDRNLRTCMNGWGLCDHSQLTPAEAQKVQVRPVEERGTNYGVLSSSTPPQIPRPSAEVERLSYFVGTWTLVGEMRTSAFGPTGKLTGMHHNEWIPGRSSLVSRWDEQRPTGTDSGTAVYSYDSSQKLYKYHGTDSEGEKEDATGTVEGNTWTWMSNPRLASGEAVRGRFTVKEDSPTSYSFKFELASKSGEWVTVMEGRATKSK